MKNLKLILALAGSLIISVGFLSFGLWANHAKEDFRTAINQVSESSPPSTPITNLVRSQSPAVASHIDYGQSILGSTVLAAMFAFYFMPSIIAGCRKQHNAGAIMVMNLLLGWTFIGWVAALIWAFTRPPNLTMTLNQNTSRI